MNNKVNKDMIKCKIYKKFFWNYRIKIKMIFRLKLNSNNQIKF